MERYLSGTSSSEHCPTCKNFSEAVSLEDSFALPLIRTRAGYGCRHCALIVDTVLALADDGVPEEDIKVGWDMTRIHGLRILVSCWRTGQFFFGIDMFTVEDQSTLGDRVGSRERATEISGDTSSVGARETMGHWIKTCSQHHSCKRLGPVPLPKRVLDVSDPRHVFLYCAEEGEVGTYACLSHCWGKSQTLQTTCASLGKHLEDIHWDDMPKTLQDAVTVTYDLGIPYLWVDTLCIIQDLERDWQLESAKMSDIYAHSTVTIAASLASDDSEGLYAKSPVCHSSIPIHDGLRIRRTLSHGHGPLPLPLLRRAWVLQERLLSPRVIHFIGEELVWECMERTTCECGCIRSLWSPGHVPFDKDLLYHDALKRAPRADVRDRWHRLVEEYSRLELTYDRDRLPAISGASRRFATFLGGQYLAGLWREGLIRDLLWERSATAGNTSKRIQAIPSWSWASICCQVVWEQAMATTELAVVLDASCDIVSDGDEYGEIVGGAIRLSTMLVEVFVSGDGRGVTLARMPSKSDKNMAGVGLVADEELQPGTQLVCARLALRRGVYSTAQDQETWIVLDRASKEDDVFRRVGLLNVSNTDGGGGLVNNKDQGLDIITII